MTLLLIAVSLSDGSGAQLTRITTTGSVTSTRIYAYFDELPRYRERVSDRRLDLTFLNTRAAELLPIPEANDIIVKTLVVQQQDDTRLSLFFRYPPQDLSVSGNPDGTLVIDLLPGNRFTGAYRDLGTSLGLLSPVIERQETLISPLTFSPYRDNWRSFFEDFHIIPIPSPVPVPFLPPFPLTSLLFSNHSNSLQFIEELNKENMFESLRLLQKRLKSLSNEEERKYYALVHADILFRLGSVAAALTQYKLLAATYGGDEAGSLAVYGAALIEIGEHRFHLARVRLRQLLDRIPASHPLAPYVRLAIAETMLATGQYEQMNQLLEQADFPPVLNEALALRRADYAYATDRYEEAFATYETFYGSEMMRAHPYSINGYCSILFNGQAYGESKRCYLHLSSILNDGSDSGSAYYLAALAELKAEDSSASPETLFTTVAMRFPGTEAALLAEMKLADICALAHDQCKENAGQWFRRIADSATSRALAESASFKEALAFFLDGEKSTSIDLLQALPRIYQSGELEDHSQALLIQLLPGEIERLLDEGLDIEAIALAQQNRPLFEKGWLGDSLLFQLGLAFERLAMHPEALRLFLYLKNRPATVDEQELLVAAIRAAHALGVQQLVEDMAAEYTYRFPEGADELDVLFYRIDSTYAEGRIDEALLLLPDPLPQRLDFQLLGATLYFQKKQYRRTADLLLPAYRSAQQDLPADLLFILAESLYELGELSSSGEIFVVLAGTEEYRQAAGLRIAQLPGGQDSEKITELDEYFPVDNAGGDPWHRFAVQDSRYRQMLSNL